MVNMKAGGHQGERKRAQATQADGTGPAPVSKLEKMKLMKDAACINANGVALRVGAREKLPGGEQNAHLKAALVAPSTLAALGCAPGSSRVLLCRPGGDFILSARAPAADGGIEVAPGMVLLGEAQRLSLHVCEDESYEWIPYDGPVGDSAALASLSVEAQLMTPPAAPISVDAQALGRSLAKRLFDEIVTDNEIFMYDFDGVQLVLRGARSCGFWWRVRRETARCLAFASHPVRRCVHSQRARASQERVARCGEGRRWRRARFPRHVLRCRVAWPP